MFSKYLQFHFHGFFRPGIGVSHKAVIIGAVNLRANESFEVLGLWVGGGSVIPVGFFCDLERCIKILIRADKLFEHI